MAGPKFTVNDEVVIGDCDFQHRPRGLLDETDLSRDQSSVRLSKDAQCSWQQFRDVETLMVIDL